MTEREQHEFEEQKRVCRCCACGAWKATVFGTKEVLEHVPCACGGNFVPVLASHTVRVIDKLLDRLQHGGSVERIERILRMNGREVDAGLRG